MSRRNTAQGRRIACASIEIDHAILDHPQRDGRATNGELGFSHNPAHRRYRVGLSVNVLVSVRLSHGLSWQAAARDDSP